MKFTCEKAILYAAISTVSRSVSSKSAIPALEGILIQADGNLTLTGYNMETAITATVDAEVLEPGVCVMTTRIFSEIIRKLPDEYVVVQVDPNYKVSVRCGISSFTFTAMSAEEYPSIPSVEYEKSISIPSSQLKGLISGTLFATSTNVARPILTGCKFEVETDSITCIAVDGYRMAIRSYTPEKLIGRTEEFVIPAKGLREVERSLDDTDDEVTFTIGDKHVLFQIDGIQIICRRLEGAFLNWRQVLSNAGSPTAITVNVQEIVNCADRVSLIIDDNAKSPIRCLFDANRLEMSTASTIGTARDECSAAGDGHELEVGFNSMYLLDALRAIPDEETVMELSDSVNPLFLTPCDGTKRYIYMVLPVRIQ